MQQAYAKWGVDTPGSYRYIIVDSSVYSSVWGDMAGTGIVLYFYVNMFLYCSIFRFQILLFWHVVVNQNSFLRIYLPFIARVMEVIGGYGEIVGRIEILLMA